MATERISPRPSGAGTVLGAAAALAVSLTGCGLLGSGPEVPSGFSTTEVNGLEVSHPSDWQVEERENEIGAQAMITLADDGTNVATIDAVYALATAVRPEHALNVATGDRFGVLPGYDHEVSETEGRGAEHGRRVDWAYTDDEGEYTGEEGAQVDGIDIILVSEEHQVHQVHMSWMNGALDSDTAEQIADSVYLDE